MKSTKTNTSVMWCRAADGTILPPFVVYRAVGAPHPSWTLRGPKMGHMCNNRCCSTGTKYGSSQRGWFDGDAFTDWFKRIFLPHAKQLEGQKVLTGDNLSSHFTPDVIVLCQEHNISFTCLPPNTTHLTQPLDVAVFGPMKKVWRRIVVAYRLQNANNSIPKSRFPEQLRLLVEEYGEAMQENLRAGFKGAGLYVPGRNPPQDANEVLKRLPRQDVDSIVPVIRDSLFEYLTVRFVILYV